MADPETTTLDERPSQIEFFHDESWSFFRRNYLGKNLRDRGINPYLEPILRTHPIAVEGGTILEVGCGAANNLYRLFHDMGAARGVGTEPSADVVRELQATFPELEFAVSDTRSLPFGTREFDLVLVRGVLCWVDRDYLLQALGEIIRVCKKFLVISDFAPTRNLSAIYHHAPDFRTYKMSYVSLIEAGGLMSCRASLSFDAHDDWMAVQTSLFERVPLDQGFPLIGSPSEEET
jgi:SAM-dependent methyltransferase